MKVTITALKAPWPAGAKVGETVDLPFKKLPGWAIGKCVPCESGGDADHVFEPPVVVVAAEPAAAVVADPDELKLTQNMLAEANRAVDEMTARLEQTEAAAAKANTERDAAVQRADEAEAALAAATKKK